MPFMSLTGDQPVYTLMLEVRNENSSRYGKIIPFLESFHLQCAFMGTIIKRFKGSGLEGLVVSSGLIEAGSADQALKENIFFVV